jgi:uncharacterized protein (TIGR02001 family)
MKKHVLVSAMSSAFLLGSLSVPAVSVADENGFSANVGMTTDYRFRGISQTDESFAIQGGFDWAHDSGFYAGIWASNVDFQIQTVDDAHVELDLYAGFGGDISNTGISYDVGVLDYNYPNADGSLDYDFTEVYGSLGYKWFTASYAYTGDFITGADSAHYLNLAADFEFEDDWSAGASWGHQAIKDNATWGTPDYDDYKVYVGKSYKGFDFELAVVGTDMSDNDCFGGSDWCDDTVTLAVSKSWE